MIQIALLDARNNCRDHGAKVVVTLKSGVQLKGRLERVDDGTGHIRYDLGWMTFLVSEVAAVESRVDR